jgi:hypothetical protein
MAALHSIHWILFLTSPFVHCTIQIKGDCHVPR